MSERQDEQPAPELRGGTGHETVDAVVASMAGLDDRPVEEHLAVFEHAHEALRRTLSGAGSEIDGPAAVRS